MLVTNLSGQVKSKSTIEAYKDISKIMQSGLDAALTEKYDEAIQRFDKAYDLAKTKDYEELISVVIIAQSRLLALTGDYEKGLEKLKLAEPYLHLIQNNSLFADFYEFKAQALLHQKKYSEALEALKICETSRSRLEPAKNWRTYNGMSRIYNQLDQKDLAEEYAQKADKLAKIQNSRKVLLDLQTELQFDEKDGTISILNSENRQSKMELKKSKFQRNIFFGGVLSLILLSTFLFIIIRQRNKINEEITRSNKIISKNLEEKEYLIKEIHHRVKNNLQVISSLLSLQSRTVEDENAMQALSESQARVHSMTLIHQNLYKDGPASHLDIKEYLTNLSQSLINTYKVSSKNIELQLNLDSILVDVGKLVPIGLIINELISNALKYAYVETTEPLLGISCQLVNDKLILKVWDNGIGINLNKITTGFGNKLIDIFAKKLEAKLIRSSDHGTRIELIIPEIKTFES